MRIVKGLPQSFQNNFSFYSEFVCSFGVLGVFHILRYPSMNVVCRGEFRDVIRYSPEMIAMHPWVYLERAIAT
jgi:hypothetical protein